MNQDLSDFIVRVVRDIDTVTDYVVKRSGRLAAPQPVRTAARKVRERIDVDALEIVLDWLARCGPAPPSHVGAAAWNLGGGVLDTIRRNLAAIQQQQRAA